MHQESQLNQISSIQPHESFWMKILLWLIFSDVYITIGALAFAYVNASLLDISIQEIFPLLILIMSATMFIYQFSRWSFFKKVYHEESKDRLYYWMDQHRWSVKVLMLLSVVCGGISVFYINRLTFFTLVILGVISTVYNLKVPLGKGRIFHLRKISFAKIFTIALVWASMSVILPWIEMNGVGFNLKVLTLFALQFLFIFIITLPFDMNDITVDVKEGVTTIPIQIGIGQSKYLLAVLTYLYLGLLFYWLYYFDMLQNENIFFGLGIAVLMYALLQKTLNRSFRAEKWQIMLWYDGSLILYCLIYLLSRWIV